MSLYVFGSNAMSQLGLPEDLSSTHVPLKHPFFEDKEIVKVSCGKLHTLVLCKNNMLYSWGVNDDCALGRKGIEEIPEPVNLKQRVVDICGGASFSAYLTDKGNVYACGTFKSTSGIIGFDEKTKFQQLFKKYKGLKNIKKIAAGHNHLLAIDSNGNLWVVGANESSQLGYLTRERHPKRSLIPSQISNNKPRASEHEFVSVDAGGFHSLAVNADSIGFGWGSNFNGQLGNKTNVPCEERTKVELENIAEISCGLSHSLFLTNEGKLYGAGDNSLFQLGVNAGKTVNDPVLILEGVSRVKAGCDFSIAQKDSKLIGWGSNMSGEIGLEQEDVKAPTEIPFDFGEILDFDCGSDFTAVATK